MNRHVNAIAGRLSLRPPQRRSLEILDRITEIAPPKKGADVAAALDAIRSEFPQVTDFEREFPSVCFALATGVGKTRLMGAFISYLRLAHGINHFFVLAPNLTIYNKLIADFTPNTPKYVFKGIAEFATEPPKIITSDNYESGAGLRPALVPGFEREVHVNIFNISKINSEVRGGKSPRIKRLSEYIGESYFDYLAGLPDLVLLMDESHRYRASAGVRAINELKPVLGLELTATPVVETTKGAVRFKNVIYDYPLGAAMADGFVKEPAVVTRKNFNPAGMLPEAIERMKLEDGLRLHESVKVDLETYARENDQAIVKPFLLVIARDTTHAGDLVKLIKSESFFEGRYADKVIQVDSSRSGAEEEEMIERLLKVEHADEPTEIVIHVNMLKEGWDVTNLYTIVPLRAANARVLIEQSIGRGLRLPYGKRTGVTSVDRLNIIAHDKFQEIIDEAGRPESTIRLQAVEIDADELARKTVTVVSQSRLATALGLVPPNLTASTIVAGSEEPHAFTNPEDQKVAQLVYGQIRKLEHQPQLVPTIAYLMKPDVQAAIVREVEAQYTPAQMTLTGIVERPNIVDVTAKTVALVVRETISIPRISVAPTGNVTSGFRPFTLTLDALNFAAVSEDLWIRHLRTSELEVLTLSDSGIEEARLEDYIVFGLADFNDLAYDTHADFLYELASQAVRHFRAYLSEDDTRKVLRCHQREITRLIRSQMQPHYWEEADGFEVQVRQTFTEMKRSAYKQTVGEPVLDFRASPRDKSNMMRYLFGGFQRCLNHVEKFASDAERKLAVILERDTIKWCRPPRGQFLLFYRDGADQLEYQPDFVAEAEEVIYMLEPKASDQLNDPIVLAKKDAAVTWCRNAAKHSTTYGGKPWRYVLIPHDQIADNMTLEALAKRFGTRETGA
ncbi:MAG: DEAD/DEAH box helicase [bacterium]